MTTTTTDPLLKFLQNRIDDDRQTAVAAGHGNALVFRNDNAGWVQVELPDNVRPTYDIRHIKTWSPDRVEEECDRKLKIIDACIDDYLYSRSSGDDTVELAEEIILEMVNVYREHPDFREEWIR